MTGCRHGAKNTLLKNYLYLAETAGAEVHPMTTVTRVRPERDGGYVVDTERTGSWVRRSRREPSGPTGGLRRRHARHAETAAPAARRPMRFLTCPAGSAS